MSKTAFASNDITYPTNTRSTYKLCCCCMELACRKSLWAEYVWMGQREVYGTMFKHCFDVTWSNNPDTEHRICEVCITRLRNAYQFKEKVLQCQLTLKQHISVASDPVKEENSQVNTEVSKTNDEQDILEDLDNEYNEMNGDGFSLKSEETNQNELEFTEDNIETCTTEATAKKKAPKINKGRRKKSSQPKNHEKVDRRKLNYIKPRQNISLIFEHSTIVPFKSNKGYFNCFYCSKQFVSFTELKKHVTEYHENMSFKSILKSILRPHDKIRVDVSDIRCRLCKSSIDNLELLVSHLVLEHNIKFIDNASPEKSIVAYDLGDGKFKCYLCKAEFLFFKTLAEHMNSHSTDYVCPVCGRCFLLPERLRAHVLKHKKEKKSVKCDDCGKICASNIHLKSHIRYTHKKLSFMCSICSETFTSYRQRMTHLEEVHHRAPLNLNCKVCSKKFFTPNSFNKHMSSEHFKAPKEIRYGKHGCETCGMLFKSRSALSYHLIVHSGEKNHECEYCHKKYARLKTLKEHLKIHMNDKRWSCAACSQAFIQKCSLKNHVRVHHVDMNFEDLIVYKKPDGK